MKEGDRGPSQALFSNSDGDLLELVGVYGSGYCLALCQHLLEKHSFRVQKQQSRIFFGWRSDMGCVGGSASRSSQKARGALVSYMSQLSSPVAR